MAAAGRVIGQDPPDRPLARDLDAALPVGEGLGDHLVVRRRRNGERIKQARVVGQESDQDGADDDEKDLAHNAHFRFSRAPRRWHRRGPRQRPRTFEPVRRGYWDA